MPSQMEYKPVRDDVPMVEGEIAVGEDIEFQRKWWKFERIVWSFFILIILADLSGLLGRGPLSKETMKSQDGRLKMKYESIERANTASIMSLQPDQSAIQDGKVKLFVSDDVLKALGAQRVIPQPALSEVGNGGVTYTFPASAAPMTIQIELKPSFVGMHHFNVGVAGGPVIAAKAFVLP